MDPATGQKAELDLSQANSQKLIKLHSVIETLLWAATHFLVHSKWEYTLQY